MKFSRRILAVLLITALMTVIGCATKTGKEQTFPDRAAEKDMATTDVTQQPAVRGVESQPVQSGPVADIRAVAGLERVHFAYNQFTLEEAARVTLEQNAIYLRNHPALKISIEGHCDERGSDEYNLALGERRAMAAKSYLVSLGIPADRLAIISYGEEKPLVAASNEEAWAKNRRAEFMVIR